ncbi:DUF3352 domain-containing protein [Stenomitos frigidus]|uniref:DUF3352 domain-containing protein n=1 Tax=Stenomitos frigidus ULC18 TaxID=2107698 RepID=A0A2T1DTG5_9CYAN|nr:DUF3352 domain-containing protein [Stenomitos frigidus]PSB23787.1 hypothetical protein C7B82_30115 [Stenomitos frigidus ULC18]
MGLRQSAWAQSPLAQAMLRAAVSVFFTVNEWLEEKALLRYVSVSFLVAVAMMPGCAIARAASVLQPPAVTTVLPDNTPGLVLVKATPAAWAEVDRFNPLPAALRPPLTVPFLPAAIDFTQDIQPWLGDEVALALVPTAGSIAGSVLQTLDASGVLLAPIKDRDRFNSFLTKLKATRGEPQIEREYKGVIMLQWSAPTEEKPSTPAAPASTTQRQVPRSLPRQTLSFLPQSTVLQNKAVKPKPELIVPPPIAPPESEPSDPTPLEPPAPKGLAIALLPGAIAVAAQVHTLEDLIDARSERPPLAQNPLFQRTWQQPQTERSLLVSYGEVAAIAKFALTIAKATPEATLSLFGLPSLFDESRLTALTKLYNTVDSRMWLEPDGIHSQANFYYTTPQPDLATRVVPDANQLLSRLPAATYLSANSRNFKQQWQRAIAAQTDVTSQLAIASFRNAVRIGTGLDLEKDIFSLMDGEYALFFFPATGGLLNYFHPKLNLGVGLMLQTSDRAAAEAVLKKLDQAAKKDSKGEMTIASRRLKGQPIISWEGKEKGKVLSILARTWVDNNTLVITTGAEPLAALTPKPYLPLHRNYTFQTAIASFPTPNEGYLYVNMGATLAFFYNLILPSVPSAEKPFVQEFQRLAGTIRSVSTTNSTTADAQRVDSLWVLAPAKQPK